MVPPHKCFHIFLYLFILVNTINISFSKSVVPIVDVLILKSQTKIVVRGVDLTRETHGKSYKKEYFNGVKKFVFNCRKKGFKKSFRKKLITFNSHSQIIEVNGNKYLGQISLLGFNKKGHCDVINHVSMEDYISTLISKEMNSAWPIETLKAQAVAARSYALYKIKKRELLRKDQQGKKYQNLLHYDLESSEKDQVSGHLFDKTKKTVFATRKTKGQILVLKKSKKLTPIFFHASCGGMTLHPHQVWSHPVKGYSSVRCPYCSISNNKTWFYKLKYSRFLKYLQKIYNYAYKNKDILSDNLLFPPHREFHNKFIFYYKGQIINLKKTFFRRFLGRKKIKSNFFAIKISKDKKNVIFKGKGMGHGVGMCQLGALNLGRRGFSYKKILKYFFPNHIVVNNYGIY